MSSSKVKGKQRIPQEPINIYKCHNGGGHCNPIGEGFCLKSHPFLRRFLESLSPYTYKTA